MDNLVIIVMPIFQGKKIIVVGSKISEAENAAFQEICQTEDRSMSYVLRELALRGLAQYKQDGQLKLTESEEKVFLTQHFGKINIDSETEKQQKQRKAQ